VTSEEIRLILVVDAQTGMPLFFRYNAGNIVDVSTLKATMAELKANGVSVRHAILDAGYCSENTLRELYGSQIHFMTRLPSNWKLFTEAVSTHRDDVLGESCRYLYQDRVIGVKRILTKLYGHRCYLYLCVDYNSRNDQIRTAMKNTGEGQQKRSKHGKKEDRMGFFALISNEKIEPDDLLSLYYTRQAVEQIFDVDKNNTNILPLRVHSEETFRGHIMLSFMATVVYLKLNACFKGHKTFTAQNTLMETQRLRCKVYDKLLLVKEPNRDTKEMYKLAGLTIPEKLKLPLKRM
jgi:transposase